MNSNLFNRHAELFDVSRGAEKRGEIKGLRESPAGKPKHLLILPGSDVRPGDVLRSKLSGDEYVIIDSESVTANGRVFYIQAYYKTRRELDAAPAPLAISQTFHGPVGAVNTGSQIQSTVEQRYGLAPHEVADLMTAIRNVIGSLPENRQKELSDQADDLEGELKSPAPKQSRLKAFLGAIWTGTNRAAALALKLKRVADAYGIGVRDMLQ